MRELEPAWRWADEVCPFADAPCPENAEPDSEADYCSLWTGICCALDLEPEAAPDAEDRAAGSGPPFPRRAG
jgi:hypothetical protein